MTFRKVRIALLRAVFIPLIALFLFVEPSWPANVITDSIAEAFEILGYLFLMAGLGLRIWATLYVGSRKSKVLLTDGPYSLCRNPLYLGTFIIVLGAGLCLTNPLMTLFTILVYIPVHVLVGRAEERHLRDLFGAEYDEYRRTVPAFLPSWKNYHSREEISVSTKAIKRVTLDAAMVLLIPPAAELIEMLHGYHLMPVLWRFP
ncbi:MAG: isoprenylcysteine carboxylmethyltransferase family protein [Phycisphaerae bacterium]|jgi:protein-S-isoprenylcysteine O-methyltransferase Ste14